MALAQNASPPPRDAQSIRVGTTIFYDYSFSPSPKATDADGNEFSPNAFNVRRAYINIRGSVSDLISFRLTPDIKRESDLGSALNGSLTFRIKYAFAQFDLDEWLPAGTRVRMGIHQTPYLESQESVYRYRFQGTTFAEREGLFSSADAGISFRSMLPNDYGDFQIGIYNGEGYTRAEANQQKSIQMRATVRPLPDADGPIRGLRVTGFYNHDNTLTNAPRRWTILAAMFEHERFNAGFDFMTKKTSVSAELPQLNGRGYSVFVTPFVNGKGVGWEGLLRYDRFDQHLDEDGMRHRLIAGGAYWFPHPGGSAVAALLFDYEQVLFSGFVSPRDSIRRLTIHGLINF
jgi:hypothetical protein